MDTPPLVLSPAPHAIAPPPPHAIALPPPHAIALPPPLAAARPPPARRDGTLAGGMRVDALIARARELHARVHRILARVKAAVDAAGSGPLPGAVAPLVRRALASQRRLMRAVGRLRRSLCLPADVARIARERPSADQALLAVAERVGWCGRDTARGTGGPRGSLALRRP